MRRFALWACLLFVVVFGVAHTVHDLTSDNATALAQPTLRDAVVPDDMRSHAMRFARAFLTTHPGHPEFQEAAIAPLLSPQLRSDAAIRMPTHGGALRVVDTSVAHAEFLASDRALVTVQATLSTGRVRYLPVTVWRSPQGGLVVSDYTAFVSPPPTASPPDTSATEQSLMGPDADLIERLLTDFFAEYLKGGVVSPVFLTPGVSLAPLQQSFDQIALVSLASSGPTTGNGRTVLEVLRARDRSSGITYTLRYRVRIARVSATDRWLVNSIQGDPSS
jgi:hypothetical protein